VVASGTTTTITTSGTLDLLDGMHSITARQTDTPSGNTESVNSGALTVTIDTAAPTADVVDVSPDPRSVGVSAIAVNFFIIVVPPNTNSNLVDSSTCNSDKTSNLPDCAGKFANEFQVYSSSAILISVG